MWTPGTFVRIHSADLADGQWPYAYEYEDLFVNTHISNNRHVVVENFDVEAVLRLYKLCAGGYLLGQS